MSRSAILDDLRKQIRTMERGTVATALPVHPLLAPAFPDGLRVGSVYSLSGSLTLATALLAEPSREGAWCGVVGHPDLGIEAVAELGVQLDRLVLVPEPGRQWFGVVAALVEVLGVVVARPPARVSPTDATRLAARLRERGTVLVATGPWPGAAADVQVSGNAWGGVGDGHGLLSGRRIWLDVHARGSRPRQVSVTPPGWTELPEEASTTSEAASA
ncbi:hypothetical protein [Nocardioides speluncae]|uniref:hypothetical protein n=1 Tax=Nocardioides speluncae TaxID=2670337 RepID=UPI000D692862|nr:hypothetical protein [Nocardioides speluncae]